MPSKIRVTGFTLEQFSRSRKPALSSRALGVVDVFLVEGPADAVGDAALDLPLDIGGVDRAADILGRDKAQDRHLAGLGIDLDIENRVEKPGAMPLALTEAAAVIRPPVSAFFVASSLNNSGGKSPTLLLAGLAPRATGTGRNRVR